MVNCQLMTNGITDEALLSAFRRMPREKFLPAGQDGCAYIDEDILLGNSDFLMEPVVFAKMLQAVDLKPRETVLNIGDATGYSSAILSGLATTVVALENRKGQLKQAEDLWIALDCCNIAAVPGENAKGSPQHAPYDVIFINGSVARAPEELLGQLKEGGRLVAVVRESERTPGMVTVFEKLRHVGCSAHRLFNASTPYVKGFDPETCFVF